MLRLKPPRKTIHDGGIEIGQWGFDGTDLPSGAADRPVGPVHDQVRAAAFTCCPRAAAGDADRICLACGTTLCDGCAPAAGDNTFGQGAPGTCPACKRDGVWVQGRHPTTITPHPDFRGY